MQDIDENEVLVDMPGHCSNLEKPDPIENIDHFMSEEMCACYCTECGTIFTFEGFDPRGWDGIDARWPDAEEGGMKRCPLCEEEVYFWNDIDSPR